LPIIVLNWDDVKIPLVICMWVLFAGIAKIGFHYANRVAPRIRIYFLFKKIHTKITYAISAKNCKFGVTHQARKFLAYPTVQEKIWFFWHKIIFLRIVRVEKMGTKNICVVVKTKKLFCWKYTSYQSCPGAANFWLRLHFFSTRKICKKSCK